MKGFQLPKILWDIKEKYTLNDWRFFILFPRIYKNKYKIPFVVLYLK